MQTMDLDGIYSPSHFSSYPLPTLCLLPFFFVKYINDTNLCWHILMSVELAAELL